MGIIRNTVLATSIFPILAIGSVLAQPPTATEPSPTPTSNRGAPIADGAIEPNIAQSGDLVRLVGRPSGAWVTTSWRQESGPTVAVSAGTFVAPDVTDRTLLSFRFSACNPNAGCSSIVIFVTILPDVGRCVGDCNEDGRVRIDEVTRGVRMLLDSVTDDANCYGVGSGSQITVAELVQAIRNALRGCPTATPTPPPTATPTPQATATDTPGPSIHFDPLDRTFATCDASFELRLSNNGTAGSQYEVRNLELWHGYSQGDYSRGFTWDLSAITFPVVLDGETEMSIPITFEAKETNSRLHVAVNSTRRGDFGEFHAVYWGPSTQGCVDDVPTPTPTFSSTPLPTITPTPPEPLPNQRISRASLDIRGFRGGCATTLDPIVLTVCVSNGGPGDGHVSHLQVREEIFGRFNHFLVPGAKVCIEIDEPQSSPIEAGAIIVNPGGLGSTANDLPVPIPTAPAHLRARALDARSAARQDGCPPCGREHTNCGVRFGMRAIIRR